MSGPESGAAALNPSAVEDWMAERHDVVPAVVFRPTIVERDEPES